MCLNNYNPYPGIVESAPSSSDYAGGFQTGLIKKDLQLAIDSGNEVGSQMKITEFCRSVFESLEEKGEGHKDFGIAFQHMM